jgi:uncharacterized coiled-coil protein SlyX
MELAIAIIGSGLLTTLITLFFTRRNRESECEKTEADAAGAIGDAWMKLLTPMEKRITALECESADKDRLIKELQKRIEELEAAGLVKDRTIQGQADRIKELESEVDTLKKQLESLGQKPKVKK